VTEQSLQALAPRQLHRDQGTQTEVSTSHPELRGLRWAPASPSTHTGGDISGVAPPGLDDTRLEKWDDTADDTAAWLYRLVFQESQVVRSESDQRTSVDNPMALPIPDFLVPSNRAPKASIVNSLLLQWTDLTSVEIEETSMAARFDSGQSYTNDLERRLRLLLSGGPSMPALPFPSTSTTSPAGPSSARPQEYHLPTATRQHLEADRRSWFGGTPSQTQTTPTRGSRGPGSPLPREPKLDQGAEATYCEEDRTSYNGTMLYQFIFDGSPFEPAAAYKVKPWKRGPFYGYY